MEAALRRDARRGALGLMIMTIIIIILIIIAILLILIIRADSRHNKMYDIRTDKYYSY